MQRRQLSERRAKKAASSLIREVTGVKGRASSSSANRPVCFLALLFTGHLSFDDLISLIVV